MSRSARSSCGDAREPSRRWERSGSRGGRSTRPSRGAASRRWWDADADDYLAEHGADIGEVDFVWCPEGLREQDARLLGDVAGARVLEVGAGSAPCARWLLRAGRAAGGARPLRAACCATPPRWAASTGVGVPLVQADATQLPFRDGAFDLACSAFGAVPFVAEPGAGDARGGPGAAARRALGVRGEPPDALDVLRRPRPGRAGRAAVLLRPHALRRGRRPRRRHLRRAPPHARRPGARRRRRGPGARRTSSSRSGRRAATRCGASGPGCAASSSPARRSSAAASRASWPRPRRGRPPARAGRPAARGPCRTAWWRPGRSRRRSRTAPAPRARSAPPAARSCPAP